MSTGGFIINIIFNCFLNCSFYILIAVGLALIFGIMRIMNMAHASLYTLGAFVCYLLYTALGLSFWLMIPVVIIVSALFGFFLYWSILGRPLTKAVGGRPVAAMLISKGIASVIASLLIFGVLTGGTDERRVIPPVIDYQKIIKISDAAIRVDQLVLAIASIVMIVALIYVINNTKIGKAMKAIVQDREAALMVGINPWRVGAIAFILGTILTGVAGFINAPIITTITPSMGDPFQIKAMMVIIVGGIGSMVGTLWAAIILGVVDVLAYTFTKNPDWATVAVFGIAMVIFAIKPSGLFGYQFKIL
ncbi:MAG: branched-chain amino acid ABC transporter permease [Chloroflexi bacterium]|nr:branched-chain amino acid ABC transporter permease [Chloroflexota bacterium]